MLTDQYWPPHSVIDLKREVILWKLDAQKGSTRSGCQFKWLNFVTAGLSFPSISIHTKIAECVCIVSMKLTILQCSELHQQPRPPLIPKRNHQQRVNAMFGFRQRPNTCVTCPSTTSVKASSVFSPEMHIAFTLLATSLDTWLCISEIRGDTTTTMGDLNICEGLQERSRLFKQNGSNW